MIVNDCQRQVICLLFFPQKFSFYFLSLNISMSPPARSTTSEPRRNLDAHCAHMATGWPVRSEPVNVVQGYKAKDLKSTAVAVSNGKGVLFLVNIGFVVVAELLVHFVREIILVYKVESGIMIVIDVVLCLIPGDDWHLDSTLLQNRNDNHMLQC